MLALVIAAVAVVSLQRTDVALDRPSPAVPVADGDGAVVNPVSVAVPSAPATDIRPADVPSSGQEARLPADTPSTVQRATQIVAATPIPSGDQGIDSLIQILKSTLDPSFRTAPHWDYGMVQSAAAAAANEDINPLHLTLTTEEAAQLDSIIQDYRTRLDDVRRDTTLELHMGLIAAIKNGDFLWVAKGDDGHEAPEMKEKIRVWQEERIKAEGLKSEWGVTGLVGHDGSYFRDIITTRKSNPNYFAQLDSSKALNAELRVATMTFFLRRR